MGSVENVSWQAVNHCQPGQKQVPAWALTSQLPVRAQAVERLHGCRGSRWLVHRPVHVQLGLLFPRALGSPLAPCWDEAEEVCGDAAPRKAQTQRGRGWTG